jgi:hypothetical protein
MSTLQHDFIFAVQNKTEKHDEKRFSCASNFGINPFADRPYQLIFSSIIIILASQNTKLKKQGPLTFCFELLKLKNTLELY